MAVICEFGTAPEQARDGYKIVGLVYGTDEELLAEYSSLDVRFVRGAAVHGQPGVWEFAAMHPPKSVQVKHWHAYGEGEAAGYASDRHRGPARRKWSGLPNRWRYGWRLG